MADETGSTVPRRQLGRVLAQLRDEAGATIDVAASALECSRQKVWRIEKGLVPVRAVDVKAMCDLYGANDELTQALMALAKETRAHGWWHAYGDVVPHWFALYVGLETAAGRLREYGAELIPGLLQTRAYAASLYRRNRPELSEEERERAVTVRMQRQALLTRRLPPPPQLAFILSEAVLRRPVPDRDAMRGQLRRLIEVATLPNVTVRILPLIAGPPLAAEAGAFSILEFPGPAGRGRVEPTTIYSEGLTGALYLDRPHEVAAYEQVWAGLDELALDDGQSVKMIEAIGEEWHG